MAGARLNIDADNSAIRQEDIPKLVELVRRDVPLLNVCGSLDFLLEKNTKVIENVTKENPDENAKVPRCECC